MTQQNAANAEQSASSSEEMLSQADWMKDMVSELIALVGGSDSDNDDRPAEKSKRIGAKIRSGIASAKGDGTHRQVEISRKKETDPARLIPLAEDDFEDF